ncbi:FecCD family ABC transporter permease [Paenibacillus jilunlii]|uniref:Ferrichrome ABC transporter permease n=1 Tax=Paenibacillus jilunlii TaxID=682956 RepID=A0A1G9KAD6_9BACL|nr:iron ABC transporter permease [Paenibacillus jilunlii]KWX69987.1 ferrichrome ABC transporter permease [Paenibacillus jilunlii]SDL46870.1 iron complex transport system permease protein [Paenibacillus jilunlii]
MVTSTHSQPRTHPEGEKQLKSRPAAAVVILIAGLGAILFGLALSVSVGAADIRLASVWEAVFRFNPELPQHQVIRELRIPRALAGALVGACFAVAGAIMQGMTRNPLADSGLLGLNAGASVGLALAFAFAPSMSFIYIMLYCFIGAAAASLLVFGIGSLSHSGLTPLRLTLSGAAVSALLLAISQGVAILFHLSQDIAFWMAGGIGGTSWTQLRIMFPWVAAALIGSLMISRSITLLSLGRDVAAGLGQRTRLVQTAGILIVVVLAGAAVSAVGPIAFIGLIIPHVTRFLVGVDYRWIIPCSAVLGSVLIIFADIAARMINAPYETPLGALIAVIGVPFFIYLASKRKGGLT